MLRNEDESLKRCRFLLRRREKMQFDKDSK